MTAVGFYLRVVVGTAVAYCFYLTRGFGSLGETFVMSLCAVLAGHGVALGARKLAGPTPTTKTLAAIAVVVTALSGAAVFVALDHAWPRAPLRYVRVDEVMAAPDRFVGSEIKLHGYLEIGSMRMRGAGDERTFTLVEHKQSIAVRMSGPVPDTLRDRAEVVARGTLRREGGSLVLVASEVMAKCPSTYNTADGPKPAAQFR
ncbi:MAG: cytochrome c maturation protein CcmE [Kofleriaceae bacterium]|nr:cytochrome c maturation protein CcmE [Kofleriaceae bacterium]